MAKARPETEGGPAEHAKEARIPAGKRQETVTSASAQDLAAHPHHKQDLAAHPHHERLNESQSPPLRPSSSGVTLPARAGARSVPGDMGPGGPWVPRPAGKDGAPRGRRETEDPSGGKR